MMGLTIRDVFLTLVIGILVGIMAGTAILCLQHHDPPEKITPYPFTLEPQRTIDV